MLGLCDALGRGLPQPGLGLSGRQTDRVGQLLDQQGLIKTNQNQNLTI